MVKRILAGKLSTIATLTALCFLAVGNVFLLNQNLQLRRMLDDVSPKFPRAGDKVKSLNATGLDGQVLRVEYGSGEPKRLFLYFTPACSLCESQFAHWREVLSNIDSTMFEVSGIVSESENLATVREYLRSVGCESLRLVRVSPSDLESYRLTRTPTTILISHEGVIEKSWVGLWNSTIKADVIATLGVTFLESPTQASD